MPDALNALFTPASVAIIGASDDPTRIGGRPLAYLRAGGFAGPLYPVNPRRETVQGLPAYAAIGATPAPAELAIVAVPGAQVVETLEQCVAAGVRAAVVFSSGFAESDARGAAAQAQVRALSRASGLRVLGPNCLGVFNAGHGLFATFSSIVELYPPVPGPVAIVSQSGAFGAHLAVTAWQRGIGVGLWVTTGNEADVGVAECIAWMAGRAEVRVIAVYLEGVTDGDALLDACDRARAAGKRIVLAKVGRSTVGAEAARSHTAALAGSDRVFDAVLRQHGVCRVEHVEEMLDVAYLASFEALPRNRRLGILTLSGGAGVLMADAAEQHGLEVPAMPAAAQAELLALLPFCGPRNPVDVTAQVINQRELAGVFLRSMLEHGEHAAIITFMTYAAAVPSLLEPLHAALAEGASATAEAGDGCRLLLCLIGTPSLRRRYEASGVAVFDDPVRAVRAVAGAVRIAEGLCRAPRVQQLPAPAGPLHPGGRLDEVQTGALLDAWGIPGVTRLTARSPAEAAAAATALAVPVAIKLLSPDVAHKTEVGGVVLGVADAEAAAQAHERIIAAARRALPDAELRGTVLSPMVSGGVELILGVRDDPGFGPVLMLGLGGVFAEVLADVVLRRAPVTAAEVLVMLGELRGAALLQGARGGAALDLPAVATAAAALSAFAAAHRGRLRSVEVNPLRVLPAGQGVLALDALIDMVPPCSDAASP